MMRKISSALYKLGALLSNLSLALMIVLMMVTVIGRYFFDYVPAWSEEMALVAMAFMGFISAGLIEYDKAHIRISIVDKYMPKTLLGICGIIRYLLKIFFLGYMTYYGYMLAITDKNKFASINFSSGIKFLPAVIAGILMIVFLLTRYREELIDVWNQKPSKEDNE